MRDMHEIIDNAGGHSWRNFEPEQFAEAWENAEGREESVQIRASLKFIESGRFLPMLENTYEFFIRLDPDEMTEWAERNPDMIKWIGVYAKVNHCNTFEKYTGISSGIKTTA